MSHKRVLHLIVKYGNQLAQGRNTIDEHRQVLKVQGAVWFGKIGAGIGKGTIAAIKRQYDAGETTYLFLLQRSERTIVHRGKIVAIKETRPDDEEAAIPAYYEECGLEGRMKLWIKLSRLVRCNAKVLSEYHTVSSGNKALHTALRSMAGVFVIAEGTPTIEVSQ